MRIRLYDNPACGAIYVSIDKRKPVVDLGGFRFNLHEWAGALGRINRFNGDTIYPYSVAQHSVSVFWAVRGSEDLADSQSKHLHLAALLHDCAEVAVGDIIWPVKQCLLAAECDLIEQIEEEILRHIFGLFDLPMLYFGLVKKYDRAVNEDEYTKLKRPKGNFNCADGFWAGRWESLVHQTLRGIIER